MQMATAQTGRWTSRVAPQLALAVLLGLVWAGPAHAEEETAQEEPADATDLAVLANDVHQEFCAEIYSGNVTLVAEGYRQVASTWEQVDTEYARKPDIVLLYWRGLLAQCLGQVELAQTDLAEFVDGLDKEQRASMRVMRLDAEKRLGRIEFDQADDEARRRRRVGTLCLSVGPAFGPYDAWQIEVLDAETGNGEAVDWLQASAEVQFSLGFELRVWRPILWGLTVGMTTATANKTGEAYANTVDFEDLNGNYTTVTVIEDRFLPWTSFHTWLGFRFYPDRPVSPVARAGATFSGQAQADPKDGAWRETVGWPMVNIAGYMGLIAESPKVVGIDVGVWFGANTNDGIRVEGSSDSDIAEDMEARAGGGSPPVTVHPRVTLRLRL